MDDLDLTFADRMAIRRLAFRSIYASLDDARFKMLQLRNQGIGIEGDRQLNADLTSLVTRILDKLKELAEEDL